MHNVPLTDTTYHRLLRRVASFEDSPEDVIVRLLDQADDRGAGDDDSPDAHDDFEPRKASRAAPGSVLPVQGYWVPILQVLEEAGGSAPSTDVIEALEAKMEGLLTPRDFERLQSGEIRWRNRARFARLRMKERGLLSDTSHRGIWEMTPAGRMYLARAKAGDQA